MKIYILGATIVLGLFYYWSQGYSVAIQGGTACVASESVKRTIQWMGSKKNYRILANGQLQVEVNGKYLNLKRR